MRILSKIVACLIIVLLLVVLGYVNFNYWPLWLHLALDGAALVICGMVQKFVIGSSKGLLHNMLWASPWFLSGLFFCMVGWYGYLWGFNPIFALPLIVPLILVCAMIYGIFSWITGKLSKHTMETQ
jgi:hypothetical protein